jgi:hypothetical protein
MVTEAIRAKAQAGGDGRATRDARAPSTREVAKFTAMVALLAIFADAAIGHGLLWENDPYWTYWVTKTFLIATVFGLGTAWLGMGVGRGAAITAVHTIVLTVYYWTFSPIGLPSHPDWLDLEHTWVTGVPVHFGVIYAGYLLSLWLWRRRAVVVEEVTAARVALVALAAGLAIVVIAGGIASAVLADFPGFTWFLVRFLLTVPFLLLWWALAGRDWVAAITGAATLAFMWATYGHFLGPSGLPDEPLRITDQEPPPANVSWLDYRELWLESLPIYLVVNAAVMLAALAFLTARGRPRIAWLPTGAALAVLVVPLLAALPATDPGGDDAELSATGPAQVERGTWYSDEFASADAEIQLVGEDRGGRVTPLEPHDALSISARVEHPTGETFAITVERPLVDDPLGRHGTWWGVGLDVWHHGESGIGTDKLPAVRSEVAVFGVGDVRVGDDVIASGVPVHVMTTKDELPGRLELNVGDEQTPVSGLPDGHLRVVWDEYSGGAETTPKWTRYAVGGVVLAAVLGMLLLANAAEVRRAGRQPASADGGR